MSKKRALIFISIVIIIVIVAGIFYTKYFNCLGVLKNNISTVETSGSAFTIKSDNIKKIKIKYKSSVNKGSICFKILDSDKNVVFNTKEFDSKFDGEKIINLDKNDEYTVEAKYKNYEGSFELIAYNIKNN